VKVDDTLKTAMGPLFTFAAGTKLKVLVKDPDDAEGGVKATDKFTVSKTCPPVKRKRIVFPAGSAVQKVTAEASEDQIMIQKQREFEADAAMVRVMKTRNVLKWNELQIQVVEALKHRFKPETTLLKKRLESLIDRKFLERDPNDRNLIKYIA
jgi:cullin 3